MAFVKFLDIWEEEAGKLESALRANIHTVFYWEEEAG